MVFIVFGSFYCIIFLSGFDYTTVYMRLRFLPAHFNLNIKEVLERIDGNSWLGLNNLM